MSISRQRAVTPFAARPAAWATTTTSSWSRRMALVIALAIALVMTSIGAEATDHLRKPRVAELASFVSGPCTDDVCGSGSTIGPDGALYVTDSTKGRIRRIDLRRGSVTTYADGLPRQIEGVVGGGVVDVAFLGRTAYVLVSGVNEFFTELTGSSNPPAADGIYRLDQVGRGMTRATLVADIYTWSAADANRPQNPSYFIPGGFTYAMEPYGRGFLVTDAHHNRVLRVGLDGAVSVFHGFAQNVVPTGLERLGDVVLVGQAGPVPHTPQAGRVVAVRRSSDRVVPVASGAPLLVDVEIGQRNRLYGLAQGDWPYEGQEGKEGFPAAPNTGYLMLADSDGQFRKVVSGLDRPTTFELIGNTAYVVTITGKVLRISGLS